MYYSWMLPIQSLQKKPVMGCTAMLFNVGYRLIYRYFAYAKGLLPMRLPGLICCLPFSLHGVYPKATMVLGVILIQIFGLWSCVDGEVARLTKSPSKLGDFYDTMADRSAEFLIFAGVLYSMPPSAISPSWGTLFFFYIGMVFLITASSEKFRSVYHKNYPKSEHERVFSWLCAGSDTRFLYLCVAILFYTFTGNASVIEWLVMALSFLLGINFIFRLWKISTFPIEVSD